MSSDTEPTGCFARIVWFLFGPLSLLVLSLMIAEKRGGWLGIASLSFLFVLLVTIAARWIDFRGGSALTAEGMPATSVDVRRFTVMASLVGLGVWFVANMIGQR
jgi:hypothetical protein